MQAAERELVAAPEQARVAEQGPELAAALVVVLQPEQAREQVQVVRRFDQSEF